MRHIWFGSSFELMVPVPISRLPTPHLTVVNHGPPMSSSASSLESTFYFVGCGKSATYVLFHERRVQNFENTVIIFTKYYEISSCKISQNTRYSARIYFCKVKSSDFFIKTMYRPKICTSPLMYILWTSSQRDSG
jgi:hypothetical protein